MSRRPSAVALLLDLFGPPPAASPDPPPPAPAPRPERPAARSEAEVLAAVRRAGGAFQRVVFTQNRRIMASVAARGAELRLNTAFAAAPEEVLRAVAALFSARTRGGRAAARPVVRAFLDALPPPADAARRPRARRAHPADEPHLERLRAEFDRVNGASFGGRLPRVPLHLSGKMRRRNGHFSSHPLEIVIARRLFTHAEPGEAEHTLRHEMIHLWQYVEGAPVDHGAAFRRLARRLDVHPRATRPVRWAPPADRS